MNVICWNCRELGKPQTVIDLCRLVKDKWPKTVFLMETKLYSNKMASTSQKVGFKNMFVVDSVGWSGGSALLWSDEVFLEIQKYSRQHINAKITSPVDGLK